MNKKTFAIALILILVLCNIVMAWFLIKPKHHFFLPDQPKNIIIKKLKLDQSQLKQYESLIDIHRKRVKERDLKIMDLKNKLYVNLKNNIDSNHINILIDSIAKAQAEIEHIHYYHFVDIKSLCNENQLNDFNQLTLELAKIFNQGKPPKK